MHSYVRKYHIVIAILLVLPCLMHAQQTGTIKGKVTDALTNEFLPSANITIQHPFLGTISGLNGNYILNNVPVGTQTLHVSYLGYQERELTIEITPGETQTANVEMEVISIRGDEIAITEQASGQRAAINQQFASLTIKNVVSSEKIEELPDANAAEAIGRLPGISLKRNSGEADKIVIRGLSPKYNIVTIEGIRMPSTNDFDRSVDLSLVQSELLSGIEVTKSLTPDMDADAIGGTVNLRLLEAPNERKTCITAEGGYANISQDFANYKLFGSYSDRIFNKRFGVSLKAIHEQKQMPSHRFNAGYSSPEWKFITDPDDPTLYIDSSLLVRTEGATLIDRQQTRRQTNGSLILDYRNKWWEVKFLNLLSIQNDDVVSRDNHYNFASTDYNFNLTVKDEEWKTMTRIHTLQHTFRFGRSKINLNLSTTFARANLDEQHFNFIEKNYYRLNQNSLIYARPSTVLDRVGGPDSLKIKDTYLRNFNLGDQALIDESYAGKLEYELSFAFGKLSGKLQLGGKYHRLIRTSDGGSWHQNFNPDVGNRDNLNAFHEMFPYYADKTMTRFGISASNFRDVNYHPGEFLNGRYKLGWSANIDTLTHLQDLFCEKYGPGKVSNRYWRSGILSYQKDYQAEEQLTASYIMTELNIGKRLMLLPGIRYERMETHYQAWHIRTNNGATGIQPNPDSVVTRRENMLWFPSINLKFKATDFISIQGAVYKSTTRPSFRQVSPFVIYSIISPYDIESNNPYLEPAKAWNYDLGVSVMKPKIGLFTVYGFYKKIDDLVFVMNGYRPAQKGIIIGGPEGLDDRILGDEYYNPLFLTESSKTNLPVNSPEKATVMGLELSWQTNFWYLPGALKGLVLDINYTILDTRTKYPYFKAVVTGYDTSNWIPVSKYDQYYQTRPGPMEDQPASILNIILGWDFKGFSSRISYRYQSRTVESLDAKYSVFDSYYDTFTLIDLMLKQQITKNLSAFANLTNIGNHIDDYYFGEQGEGKPTLPTSSQYYGFRAQVGIKMKF